MKVDFSQNTLSNRKQSQSFGAIKLSSGAEPTLRDVLKPKEWALFSDLVDKNADIPVDIILFGRGKKLDCRIVPDSSYIKIKDYSQRFFESPIEFIQRMDKKAEKVLQKIKELGENSVNVDDILSKVKD